MSDLNKGLQPLVQEMITPIEEAFKPQFTGGFDVVIGNPPYFNIQTLGFGSKEAHWIQQNYPDIWQDKSDILFFFIRKALELSKSEIGYIISNAFLFSDKAQKLRNKIIEDGRLNTIVNFEKYLVFEDASITSCIIIFRKNNSETKSFVLKDKNYTSSQVIEYIFNPQNSFSVNLKANDVFALINNSIDKLNKNIDRQHKKLQEICYLGKGMETAANHVYLFDDYPNQFPNEFIKKRMVGENIVRYCLKPNHSFMLYFEHIDEFDHLPINIQDHLIANKEFLLNRATVKNEGRVWWRYSRPMHKDYYHLNKIWCSYRGKNNAFYIDESSDFIGLTNTTVIFDTNTQYSLKYILTLLNSKLLNFRYKSIGKQTGSGVFEYFANSIGKMPIPNISPEAQLPFIELADIMLEKNKELQEVKNKFLDLLKADFSIEKLRTKLQNWYELSWADFSAELRMLKIELKGIHKEDWSERHTRMTSQAQEIKTLITQTDRTIDRLVYQLYELSEEEIKIVEGE